MVRGLEWLWQLNGMFDSVRVKHANNQVELTGDAREAAAEEISWLSRKLGAWEDFPETIVLSDVSQAAAEHLWNTRDEMIRRMRREFPSATSRRNGNVWLQMHQNRRKESEVVSQNNPSALLLHKGRDPCMQQSSKMHTYRWKAVSLATFTQRVPIVHDRYEYVSKIP
ncbi:hypothetical protein DIPPA_19994 [Diplonema papillatum]|nr:hypothetical protein DIPPA_19994 [Diplonema papillatum]